MIYCLGASDENCLLASRIYAQRFPHAERHPNCLAFERLKERFERTGNVNYERNLEREKSAASEENQMAVMQTVVENPYVSCRQIARELDGIEKSTVNKIIRKAKFHPYHVQLVQDLTDEDFVNRRNFCRWALNRIQQQHDFFEYVLFTDEATFHKNGYVNRHNFH